MEKLIGNNKEEMNYELAKQLKDAGFPKIHFDEEIIGGKTIMVNERFPTLSELIGACGDEFKALYNLTDEKYVYEGKRSDVINGPHWDAESNNDHMVCGSTPEEAVAKLWLELQK